MIRMEVNGVYSSSPQSSYPQVVLKEVDGDCYLPIVIGRFEAAAISMAHSGQQPARPISYDLACHILQSAEAQIEKVEITDLHESTYYAEVHLQDETGEVQVLDARPSDAIALALRTGAPIYAAPAVLDEAGYKRQARALTAEVSAAASESRRPGRLRPKDRLEQLKRRLRQAVAEEVYEEAARLRDEINRLERQ